MSQFLPDKEFSEIVAKGVEFITDDHCNKLTDSLEKKYAKILKVGITKGGCRIVLSDDGFTILFPENVWHKFDVQLNDRLTIVERDCWACDTTYTFVKVLFDKNEVIDEFNQYLLDYISDNLDKRMNAVVNFLNKNFIDNPRAYPDSEYFTIGSYLKNPQMPRPFRMRLGGNFRVSF
ncbi:hypothetical protein YASMINEVIRUS_581 [Yasminevirus sp. GU-2018]|uniref:Uncharacterized protein n=1 Tax=Yasminevirus sp. GU-2018 TaxID=2420051 RepID=A0A5K0U7X8_9VIRU|nr:hypothetical protein YASMINEVIRUS_581 [Yasminevirus sp. GU-2018]